MPKKFVGENSKAAQARAKKSVVNEAAAIKKQKQIEDELWKDDDKHTFKKQQRKDEQERKKQISLEKKTEVKVLLEHEIGCTTKIAKVAPPPKITRAHIAGESERQKIPQAKEKVNITHLDIPLEENMNRITIDGEEARDIDEAINILSIKDAGDVDKHPEKRKKAAHTAFEERRLKELKEENPTLRMSQLKHYIFKEWNKSSENPPQ